MRRLYCEQEQELGWEMALVVGSLGDVGVVFLGSS